MIMKMFTLVIINFIIIFIILFCLLYANTYLNEHMVPDSLLWKNDEPRLDKYAMMGVAGIKTLALLTEGVIFVIILYFLNRLIMNNQVFIIRFLKIEMIIISVFISIVIWGSFRSYLW